MILDSPKIGNLHLHNFATKNFIRALLDKTPPKSGTYLHDFATKNLIRAFIL